MIRFNYHSHTTYCDGSDKPEDMIKSAIRKGLKYYGVSTHGPVPFVTDWTLKKELVNSYIEEVLFLKNKYKDKIKILLGLEIDYLPEAGYSHINQEILDKLDYVIGSVHYLGKNNDGTMWTVDYTRDELQKGIEESFNGNVRNAVEEYYENLGKMAEILKPDIIAHLDLIKKNNKGNYFFDENEEWYRNSVKKCLLRISKSNSIMEINTGGKSRSNLEEYYPSDWILEEILNLDIPVTISSDAHMSENVDFEFDEAMEKIKNIGFKEIFYLTEDGKRSYAI